MTSEQFDVNKTKLWSTSSHLSPIWWITNLDYVQVSSWIMKKWIANSYLPLNCRLSKLHAALGCNSIRIGSLSMHGFFLVLVSCLLGLFLAMQFCLRLHSAKCCHNAARQHPRQLVALDSYLCITPMVLSSIAAEMLLVLFTLSAGLRRLCAVARTFHFVLDVPEHHLRLCVVQHLCQCAVNQRGSFHGDAVVEDLCLHAVQHLLLRAL